MQENCIISPARAHQGAGGGGCAAAARNHSQMVSGQNHPPGGVICPYLRIEYRPRSGGGGCSRARVLCVAIPSHNGTTTAAPGSVERIAPSLAEEDLLEQREEDDSGGDRVRNSEEAGNELLHSEERHVDGREEQDGDLRPALQLGHAPRVDLPL